MMQIAEHCGVSLKTVSRVLNHPEQVSPKTRDAVRKSMEQCGFQVNLLAKGLKQNRTNIIIVFLDKHNGDYIHSFLFPNPCTLFHHCEMKHNIFRPSHRFHMGCIYLFFFLAFWLSAFHVLSSDLNFFEFRSVGGARIRTIALILNCSFPIFR